MLVPPPRSFPLLFPLEPFQSFMGAPSRGDPNRRPPAFGRQFEPRLSASRVGNSSAVKCSVFTPPPPSSSKRAEVSLSTAGRDASQQEISPARCLAPPTREQTVGQKTAAAMGFGMTCVKYLMFFFNFVFALAGLALLIVGALMQAKVGAVSHYLEGKFSAPPIFMIVIGSIVFVVAFYGCCGAIRESSCMVTTFSIFLMVILVAEITVAVLAFVYRNEYQSVFTTEFARNVADYGSGNKTNDGTVDAIQATLECCGAQGPQDYSGRTLPRSCCVEPEGTCTDVTNGAHVFLTGCEEALKNFINNLGLLIGCLAIGVAFIMVMGIIFGLCLASSIRNEIRRGYA